jgi:FG-GAP-like repeat
MRFLRISFVICLFLSLNIFAVDNSFKLDFDGDGRTDIALYREGSRSAQLAPQASYWYFLNTQTGQASAVHWGRTFDVPAPADYDNDGKTDVAIYRWWDFNTGDTNEWWISKSTGGHQILVYELGYNKYSRNYFGDGAAETGQIYLVDINQEPNQDCFIGVYFAGDLGGNALRKPISNTCNAIPTPVPGDYNNDGFSEIAVFDNQTFRVWYAPYNSAYTTPDIVQTLNVDSPAPGDYDGDGKTDFAGIKSQNGRMIWRIKQSNGGAEVEFDFGLSTDKPVPGDYDGDHKTDIAVWRPSDASWWIMNSGKGNVSSFVFGLSTDTPLAMPTIPFNPL